MTEFWESAFTEKQAMWGFTSAQSAIATKDLFLQHGSTDVLIPGIGYGRNADVFRQNGMSVTGIEISKTAIEIARSHFGPDMRIFIGSVSDMPFEEKQYGGIFCFALIHLLDATTRAKFIKDCYNQLKTGGYMVFVTISKEDFRFGKGTQLETDRFEAMKGVQLFFYDEHSVQREFGAYGLTECIAIDEPNTHADNQPVLKFLKITCQK